jgi:Zn-finger nucleic acid-binding protein
MYKCENCGSSFEKSQQYEAEFCPHCGESFIEKSVDVELDDLICTNCESVFEKSVADDTEFGYCPKCGKSLQTFRAAMAEAEQATGDDPEEDSSNGPKEGKLAGGPAKAAMAEAEQATGDAPRYKAPTKKATGISVSDQGEGANSISGSDKEGYESADGEDTDEHEPAPAAKKLEKEINVADAQFKSPVGEKVGVYAVKKSLDIEKRLEAIEKSLSQSVGRQTVVPGAFESSSTVEKSQQPSQIDLDRSFVKELFGR